MRIAVRVFPTFAASRVGRQVELGLGCSNMTFRAATRRAEEEAILRVAWTSGESLSVLVGRIRNDLGPIGMGRQVNQISFEGLSLADYTTGRSMLQRVMAASDISGRRELLQLCDPYVAVSFSCLADLGHMLRGRGGAMAVGIMDGEVHPLGSMMRGGGIGVVVEVAGRHYPFLAVNCPQPLRPMGDILREIGFRET